MRQLWSERIKQRVRPALFRALSPSKPSFECPICGYEGPFKDKPVSREPHVYRTDSKCMGCGAAERHRMMSLVLDDVLDESAAEKRLLHIAPEFCLQPRLRRAFGVYHTADLLRDDVDFNEDVQAMSFPDGSYDCVYISRVLTIPPDLESCVREIRRVLKPRGFALIAETYTRQETLEYGELRAGRSRVIGVDFLQLCERHFARVDRFVSGRYAARYQLTNRMRVSSRVCDDYPAVVRAEGVGFQELVAVCHA